MNLEEAAEKHGYVVGIFRSAGMLRGLANALHDLGTTLYWLNEDREAVAVLREAQDVYEKLGLELNVAHCVFVEGLALESMLAVEMPRKKFKRAYKIFVNWRNITICNFVWAISEQVQWARIRGVMRKMNDKWWCMKERGKAN